MSAGLPPHPFNMPPPQPPPLRDFYCDTPINRAPFCDCWRIHTDHRTENGASSVCSDGHDWDSGRCLKCAKTCGCV